MSYMFEVYYKSPPDLDREAALATRVSNAGGRLAYREEPDHSEVGSVCLTFEFEELEQAETAAQSLRRLGEHVEGPQEYAA